MNYDYDLFFIPTASFKAIFGIKKTDGTERIHIATAGGKIPSFVYENNFNHESRYELLNSASISTADVNENPSIINFISSSLDKDIDEGKAIKLYLSEFKSYAMKNCFSFDRTNIDFAEDNKYHVVAYPSFSVSKYMGGINNSNLLFKYIKINSFVLLVLDNYNSLFGCGGDSSKIYQNEISGFLNFYEYSILKKFKDHYDEYKKIIYAEGDCLYDCCEIISELVIGSPVVIGVAPYKVDA